MSVINGNLTRKLDGQTNFVIDSGVDKDVYRWLSNRELRALELWHPEGGIASVTLNLVNSNWHTNLIQTGGGIATTINDASTGSGRFIGALRLEGAGNNLVTLTRTEVQILTTGSGNDTVTGGAGYIGFIATGDGNDQVVTRGGVMHLDLGDGNNKATIGAAGAEYVSAGIGNDTLTANGEVGTINAGRGHDLITTGTNYAEIINAGRGIDKVVLGSGGAGFVALGRDADVLVVKQQASPTDVIMVSGGGNISTPEDEDRDLVSFAAFTTGISVNLATGAASSAQGSFYLREIEEVTGGRGADHLVGDASDNALTGGAGRDTLAGGEGADRLRGDGGADRFVFASVADSTAEAADTILGFSRKQGDRIDLSAMDADTTAAGQQGFAFIGSNAFTGTAGELRVIRADSAAALNDPDGMLLLLSGGDSATEVQGDVDGDGIADLVFVLNASLALRAGDFILG